MGEFSTQLLTLGGGIYRRAATEQSGIFGGLNPATFNVNDPFVLWVIQSIIIIAMTQFLAFFLGRIRQPRVISEVIGGVLLGPTVMGRIPNFTNSIFPSASLQMLSLTSTIGLVFFLFLVGLELDVRVVTRNAKASSIISVAGLAIPLGLGAALAIPLYDTFIDPSINRGYFILFVAVAVGITAFPVLCRILTEVKLLETTVGVLVLSAGVGNDVVGWILLALAVALVNASTGLDALWVLLTGVGFVLFLLMPVKWAYVWVARRYGGLERGEPTSMMMTVTLVTVLFCAFFTDIIGIHPIFGGFLAGLIIPKENGFEISLVEKLEDFISLLLLPQYFALSGLHTNLGLLDNGITWGYTILICVVAFFAKFLSCSITAKAFGFNLRESGAVGSLMACKGLVELIVLNVGLSAGILNTRVFSMFVLHALVLTFITTPLTLAFYPPKHRRSTRSLLEGGDGVPTDLPTLEKGNQGGNDEIFKSRFSLVMDKIEQLPAAMTLTSYLRRSEPSAMFSNRSSIAKGSVEGESASDAPVHSRSHGVSIDALRLIELTERTSAVMKSQSSDVLTRQDPILSVFKTFAQLNGLAVSSSLSVVAQEEYGVSVASHARETASELIIVPWALSHTDVPETATDSASHGAPANPFDTLFRKGHSGVDLVSAAASSHLIRRVFAHSPSDVALFVDRGMPQTAGSTPHILLPFFGGPDDRLALNFVVQLCTNPSITATIVRMRKTESEDVDSVENAKHDAHFTSIGDTIMFPDTVYGAHNTQTRLQSETADNIAWTQFASGMSVNSSAVAAALSRIIFEEETSARPLHRVLEKASEIAITHSKQLLVVVGRSRRMAVETHKDELLKLASKHSQSITSDVPKTFGEVATAFVATGANVNLLVLQSASS